MGRAANAKETAETRDGKLQPNSVALRLREWGPDVEEPDPAQMLTVLG